MHVCFCHFGLCVARSHFRVIYAHSKNCTFCLKGVHVQINARNDDDVDEDVIMEKVKNSSGANYGFHKEKPKAFIPQGNIVRLSVL